ncbi:CHASE3 domain-containing protein [Chamaesiphon sp.]|uniref:sensor histidine kinase n=1 Tax=Chamaesiphon sp. TaxID=2814140 RepID=UPI003593775D
MKLMQDCGQKIQAYWNKMSIAQRGAIAICIPLACLVCSVVAHTIFARRIIDAQQHVVRTHEVIAKCQSVSIGLLDAETGVRDYYIVRQKVLLEPYKLAVNTLEPALIRLEQLVRDKPTQALQARRLASIAHNRMNTLQQSIQRIEATAFGSLDVKTARLIAGKQEINRFRDEMDRFEAPERRLLGLRTRSLQKEQQIGSNGMWVGLEIGIIGTIVAARILKQLSTELSDRQLRLDESQNLIQAIVGNVVDGVAVIDPQGNIKTFNHAAVEMFGYTLDEVVGCNWKKLSIPEVDVTQKLQLNPTDPLQTAIPDGKIWLAMGKRKNGEWFPIEFSIDRIGSDEDSLTMTIGERIVIIRDITTRQQAAAKLYAKTTELVDLNDALNFTNQSLQATNSELDRFAYITSHDLKAPLRAIASLSEWIEEDLGANISGETRSQMQLLRRRVHRMQALLNSLLEYSRSGRTQTPSSSVDVNCLVVGIIKTLAPPATFTIEIAPLPTFETRKQQLTQVFSHLIDNAIRHHPTKMGIVEISAIDLGDRYEFTVADNGDGIEPQYQHKIYTIFQTLKPRDLHENIGAGLAIVKKVILAEGGTIQLESAAGGGAVFKFTWPKQPINIQKYPR